MQGLFLYAPNKAPNKATKRHQQKASNIYGNVLLFAYQKRTKEGEKRPKIDRQKGRDAPKKAWKGGGLLLKNDKKRGTPHPILAPSWQRPPHKFSPRKFGVRFQVKKYLKKVVNFGVFWGGGLAKYEENTTRGSKNTK